MKRSTLTGAHKLMTVCDVRNFNSLLLPVGRQSDNKIPERRRKQEAKLVLLLHYGAVKLANLSNTFLPEVGFCVTVENIFKYTQPLQRLRTVSYRHVL